MNQRITITDTFYDIKVSEWLCEYREIVASYPLSDKTHLNRRILINHIETLFGEEQLLFLKPYVIQNKLKLLTPSQAKRILIELKNVFKEAIVYDKTNRNPAEFVKRIKVEIQRERLTFLDFRSIYACALYYKPAWVSDFFLLALITGQRRADVAKLHVSDIQDDHLHVTQQKTGAKIAIPLGLKMMEVGCDLGSILQRLVDRTTTGFLIERSGGKRPCLAYISDLFHKCAIAGGVSKNVSLHECRSLAERIYRAQGINTRLLLGHTNWKMTDIYNDDRGLSSDSFNYVPLRSYNESTQNQRPCRPC
jgi:integrase